MHTSLIRCPKTPPTKMPHLRKRGNWGKIDGSAELLGGGDAGALSTWQVSRGQMCQNRQTLGHFLRSICSDQQFCAETNNRSFVLLGFS